MIRNPSLKKIIQILQLAQIVQKKPNEKTRFLEEIETLREKKVSRREVLGITSNAAMMLPFSGLIAKRAMADLLFQPPKQVDPVVIVGAGVAGLVAAYRLQKVGIPAVLYEASDRTGGRMFTQENFTDGGLFCELGGELVDEGHRDLIDLCSELNIPIQDLTAADQGLNSELFYVNDRLMTEADLLVAFQPLALQISEDIQKLFSDGEVRIPTYRDQENPIFLEYDQIPLSTYLSSKKDIDPWVLDLINVLYVCEYGLESNEQSTLNFLTLVSADTSSGLKLFGESDESKRILGGSSALPKALEKVIRERVPIYLNHPLVKIQDNSSKLTLTFMKGQTPIQISAKQVICTLPFTVLRNIEGISRLEINPATLNCIQSLGYGANSKLMMGFKTRIWRELNHGKSNGALVTTVQQQYWETSRMQPGTEGILTQFMGGDFGKKIAYGHLDSSLKFLNQVFPDIHHQFNGKKILKYWPNEPWQMGSYTCLKPGQYTSMHGLAAEPELSGRLFFAGEHTSVEWSGFMNGAVQSGNLAAQNLLAYHAQRHVDQAVAAV